jgi:hypothetical protein
MQFQIVDVGTVVVRPFRFKFIYSLSSVLSKFNYSNVVHRSVFLRLLLHAYVCFAWYMLVKNDVRDIHASHVNLQFSITLTV